MNRRVTLRALLVWLLATIAAIPLGRLALDSARPPATTFDDQLVRLCALALLGALLWGWCAVSTVVLEAAVAGEAAGRSTSSRPGVPAGLRRLVLTACGIALVSGATPALATPGPVTSPAAPTAEHAATAPLHEVTGETAREPVHGAASSSNAATFATVQVRTGDSLWRLADRHLAPGASDADVTAAWQRIYAANRAVIGDDPSLIRPGQRLVVPHEEV